jgi:hypothetical protein
MKNLETLKKETPWAKRILIKLAKVAVKRIPVIGAAYEIVDETLLETMAEKEQEKTNELVGIMYEKLEPLMRRLESDESLTDEKLEEELTKKINADQLKSFEEEVKAKEEEWKELQNELTKEMKGHGSQIEDLSAEVARLGNALDVTSRFKHIAPVVRHKLSVRGSIKSLYDIIESQTKVGGQGAIRRAHRKGTREDKRVIVKGLKAGKEGDTKAVQRFLLEGFLASQIVHPNIVRVTDFGGFLETDEYFIEMEDLGNKSLKEWAVENPFKSKAII